MAQTGMLQRSNKNGTDGNVGGDEVQRSLELLDQVLSEFDERPPPSPVSPRTPRTPHTPATPDDDSPSLTGHQSEDDGYMSMNGRRAKFALGFRPTVEQDEWSAINSPPPPEEAEKILSKLLPKSPSNSAPAYTQKVDQQVFQESDEFVSLTSINGKSSNKQTTFPKTKHQRPYGWDKEQNENEEYYCEEISSPQRRFSSLQIGNKQQKTYTPPNWLPPKHPSRIDRLNERFLAKKSPSLDNPPTFPFDFASGNKPYNEHPVTIYPGPNVQFNKQNNSPYNIPKFNRNQPTEKRNSMKKDNRQDVELMSPKSKIPPKSLAGSIEKHREVHRGLTENEVNSKSASTFRDEEHFSDDSLEENFPPPPSQNVVASPKRNSIAWEVSLDDDNVMTPGSTKVIGRRRRKSGDNSNSSTNSLAKTEDGDWIGDPNADYWPPPPLNCSTEDEFASPFSDTDTDYSNLPSDMSSSGTYVIRRGKPRKQLPAFSNSLKNKRDMPKTKSESIKSHDNISVSTSATGLSGSHNSVSSYNSRTSSNLSNPKSRHSVDLNTSRISKELNTPNSRFSIDICTPNMKLLKEINSPKSRLSLDLNNSKDQSRIRSRFEDGISNFRSPKIEKNNKSIQKKLQTKLSPQNRFGDFKKYSSTFDNIKSLIKEGIVEDCPPLRLEETAVEIPVASPHVVRVVSLPSLADEPLSRPALITTVEEEEDPDKEDNSPLRKIENNISAILSRERFAPFSPKDWDIHRDEYDDQLSEEHVIEGEICYGSRERRSKRDVQKSASHSEIPSQRSMDRRERSFGRRGSGVQKSTSSKDVQGNLNRQPSSSDSAVSSVGDFPVNVHIVEHSFRPHNSPKVDLGPLPKTPESPSFPPLPPSPVPEVDEYSEIFQPHEKNRISKRSHAIPEIRQRSADPPAIPPHRDTNSLKTRSMEASYSKNKRNSSNFKNGSTDRRTLPTDGQGIIGRRTVGRGSRSLQASASLPETPIFTRNLTPRTSNTINNIHPQGASSTLGGYGRGSTEHSLTGAELLRLAGGPGRGWYPRQKHRPASIENIDRITGTTKSISDHNVAWDGTGSRKPLTLPPNLTPKFFNRSPREALRRVTSLLIRKGNNKEKESRFKETTSPSARSANGDDIPGQKPRRGFFRSLWKKSRHYSLEHP